MSRRFRFVMLVLSVAMMVGAPAALAAKGGNGGGKLSATIDMMPTAQAAESGASAGVWFDVTRSRYDYDDVMWAVNTCWDGAGEVAEFDRQPVIWGEWDSLEGVAGSFATGGVACTVYVTLKPWTGRALGDAIYSYTP